MFDYRKHLCIANDQFLKSILSISTFCNFNFRFLSILHWHNSIFCTANFTFLNRQVHVPTLLISSFGTSNFIFLCTANLKFSVISALSIVRVYKANWTFFLSLSTYRLSTAKLTFPQCQYHVSALPTSRFCTANFTFLDYQIYFSALPNPRRVSRLCTACFTFLHCQVHILLYCQFHFLALLVSIFLCFCTTDVTFLYNCMVLYCHFTFLQWQFCDSTLPISCFSPTNFTFLHGQLFLFCGSRRLGLESQKFADA